MGLRHREETVAGEDSFMDTIANLVGIMIILVVIVSARGYTTAKVLAESWVQDQIEEMENPKELALNLERDLESQIAQLQRYEMEVAYRSAERMTMVDRVHLAEQFLEEKRQDIDSETALKIETDQAIDELERQLADLLRQTGELPPDPTQSITLQHLPTPMARTVFGKELHVMLQNNLVSVIPWDLMIDSLKDEVRRSVARNSQRDKIEDRLGPIDGFIMRYRLLSRSGIVSDGRQAAMGKMVELDKFELDPTPEVLRQSVTDALGPGGRLRAELEAGKSQLLTITVWVYPESFGSFRTLKERLFAEGFLCAARPLPANMKIGASPKGSSSVAQ